VKRPHRRRPSSGTRAPEASISAGTLGLCALAVGVLLGISDQAWAGRPVLFDVAERPSTRNASTLSVSRDSLGSRSAHGRSCRAYAVSFHSHGYGSGSSVRIFGYYAVPEGGGVRRPGLVMIHGGGGYALLARALDGAGQGYAALAIDLPGKGPGRSQSRSSGPNMTVANLFNTSENPEDNYLYHAVTAALRSITYLCAQPEVDTSRIGVYGISWGGVVSLVTGSVDKRVTAVMDMFGSGYLYRGSTWTERLAQMTPQQRERWEHNFDASSYVGAMKCPILCVSGTNDNCYWLPSFMRTFTSMDNERWLLLRPNLDHKIDAPARQGIWAWLNQHLAHNSPAAPSAGWWYSKLEGDEIVISTTAQGSQGVRRAEVTCSRGGGGWARRRWHTVACDRVPGRFSARLRLKPQPLFAYATFFFEDGSAVSSSVRTLAALNTGTRVELYDVPMMCEGALMAPAQDFLASLGAEIVPELSTSRTLAAITAEGLRPIPCTTLGGECYVELRSAAQKLGATVHWDGQMIHIYWRGGGPKPVSSFEVHYPPFYVGDPDAGSTGTISLDEVLAEEGDAE
jgi:dienelactone hydrolase